MSFDHASSKMNFNVFDTSGDISFSLGEGVEKLTIDNTNVRVHDDLIVDGDVGIGVSTINNPFSAQAALQVGDTSTTTNNGLITIGSGTSGSGDIYFADGTSGGSQYRGFVSYKHNGDYLAFGTAETTRMIIDSSGNVGINETSPSSYFSPDLVVKAKADLGGITIRSNATSDNNYLMFADGTSGNAAYRGYVNYNHSADSMTFGSAAVARLTIDSSGNSTFAGNVSLGGSTTSYLESRYNTTSQYSSRLAFNGLQLGNNGENRIIAGRTSTGGPLAFYVNNTNDGLQNTPDGILALTLANTGNATFAGSVNALNLNITNSSQFNSIVTIEKIQQSNQFDTSSFLRLHPSAITNFIGYTNMFFGTSTANNFGVAIGAVRAGNGDNSTNNNPAFAVRILNDSIIGTEVLRINDSGNSTFAGDINISSPGDLYINSGTSYNNKGSIFMSNQRTEIVSDLVDGTANGDTSLNFKTRSAGATASAMFIDEFRNVGIGTASPTSYYSNQLVVKCSSTENGISIIANGTNDSNYLMFGDGISGGQRYEGYIEFNHSTNLMSYRSSGEMRFLANSVERMRIDSSGNIQSNANSGATIGYGFQVSPQSGYSQIYLETNNTQGLFIQRFYNPNGNVGNIMVSGSATIFSTSSDYRLKENVVEITGALDRVSQLKPSRFNFIADADKTVDGFLAHEVQEIVPEAITGEKDAMRTEEYEVSPAVYEDVVHPTEEAVYKTIENPAVEEELDDEGNIIVEGKEAYTEEVLVTEAKEEWTEKVLVSEKVMGTREVPDYQGIDQSKLVPLLVGAIQELKAEVDKLKQECKCKN